MAERKPLLALPVLFRLPRMVKFPIARRWLLPQHEALISECAIMNDTKGVTLPPPECVWAGQTAKGETVSLWLWILDGDVEMFSLVTEFMVNETPYIGVEFSRCGYDAFTITVRENTASFPLITEMPPPAVGYVAFSWPKD